jgi:response regulator aspartate phosphatase C
VNTNIAFEVVGKTLNEWYKVIKQNNIVKAESMKKEIQKTLSEMEENQTVLLYYNLIDSRFKLMTENYSESGNLLTSIEDKALEGDTDDMIRYYFFFFSGMYEFYKKNFTKAINYYRLAERLISSIPDEAELAEFNYQIAIAYYEIHQNFFSLNHAEKALESFAALDDYINRSTLTKMVIAHNKLDLHQYDSAEALFKESIQNASHAKKSYTEALGQFNLGICYERQDKLDLARDCFESALDLLEQQHSRIFPLRTIYMLSRVLFKKGLIDEGDHWYKKAHDLATELNEKTYQSKLSVIHSIYSEPNESLLDKDLNSLKESKLWTDVADLAINAARHFKKQERLKLASKYYEEGIIAMDKIQTWTEEINS